MKTTLPDIMGIFHNPIETANTDKSIKRKGWNKKERELEGVGTRRGWNQKGLEPKGAGIEPEGLELEL